jgi:NhaA family Na+:H+ antiporter
MSHTTSQGISRFGDNIRNFLKLEGAGGLVLMAAMILAIIVKNSPLSPAYQ